MAKPNNSTSVESKISKPKRGLSKQLVVNKAIELVDAEGLEALSMRALGKSLDVEAMTLYRYVDNRQTLLNDILDYVVDEMHADPETLLRPQDNWDDYLRRVARGARRIALAHPRILPLMISQPPAAPWVRPPLRSLSWIEAFIAGLETKGFDDKQTVRIYRSFTGFLLGHLLLEVSSLGVELVPAAEAGEPPSGPDIGSYPNLLRMAPLLAHMEHNNEFEDSLNDYIRGVGGAEILADVN